MPLEVETETPTGDDIMRDYDAVMLDALFFLQETADYIGNLPEPPENMEAAPSISGETFESQENLPAEAPRENVQVEAPHENMQVEAPHENMQPEEPNEDMQETVPVERAEGAASIARPKIRFSPSKDQPIFIEAEAITEEDVYSGREYRGSHHPGNVRFRNIIRNNRELYRSYANRHGQKTSLSKDIMNEAIRGRFIGRTKDGRFYLLTASKAQAKVSQSLRENTN